MVALEGGGELLVRVRVRVRGRARELGLELGSGSDLGLVRLGGGELLEAEAQHEDAHA